MCRLKNAAILFIILIVLPAIAGGIENTYKMCGWVVSADTIEDETGNLWGYDTELAEGTEIKITFDNAGTPDRKDDIILKIR